MSDIEEHQPDILTKEDVEAVNNITKYNLDPNIRQNAIRSENYKESSERSQQSTAETNHSLFRGLVKQFGNDMFSKDGGLLGLIKKIRSVPAQKDKDWSISTASQRLNLLALYIEYNPDIYERCSDDLYEINEAIEMIHDNCEEITKERKAINANRYELKKTEVELFVRIEALKKCLREYWKIVGKTNEPEKNQNKLLPALYLFYPVRRNELLDIKAIMVIQKDTPKKYYSDYPTEYINTEDDGEEKANKNLDNYILMMKDGNIKIIFHTYKTAHMKGDLNKITNANRKPLRFTEKKHHKELVQTLSDTKEKWEFLFSINSGPNEKNKTKRLQESFQSICGLPLGVNILRKIFIYENKRKFQDKLQRQQLAESMVTTWGQIDSYYDVKISLKQILKNEAKLQVDIVNVQRVGPYKKEEKFIRIEILKKTRGILWDVKGKRISWSQYISSPMFIDIDDNKYQIKEVFKDISIPYIKKLTILAKENKE